MSTKTKQQIQEEIAALQKQLEEMDQPKTYHYLMLDGAIACTPIKDIFNILPGFDDDDYDQPHELGKFETREEAGAARFALIGLLHLLKSEINFYYTDRMNIKDLIGQGQAVIKAIEEGYVKAN